MRQQKKAVSIRLAASDLRQIKSIAARLGARDSDVVRFALKWTLSRIAPIGDPQLRGRGLVPVFVEAGSELIRHFELDAARLETLINEGSAPAQRVLPDDIALLTMSPSHPSFVSMRLTKVAGSAEARTDVLRNYLYEKYVYKQDEPEPAALRRDNQSTQLDPQRR